MAPIFKRCSTCGHLRPITDFNIRRAAKDGVQSRCRECSRAWYEENKATHKANVRRRNDAYRLRLRALLTEYLSTHPCVDCGESDIRCLDFDHRDRATKTTEVSQLIQHGCSWRVIQAEIEKCDVRCANCHRRRTAGQFSTWRHDVHAKQSDALRGAALARLQRIFPTAVLRDDSVEPDAAP